VIGVCQRDAPNPKLLAKMNGSRHACTGIEISRSASSVPLLDGGKLSNKLRPSMNIDSPVLNHFQKTWEPVNAMRVNAIEGRFGE
jgi:hypothetical protein